MIQASCALASTLPAPLKLLLIDDHQLFLDGLTLTLQKLDVPVEITRANTGAEGYAALASSRGYHLVLLDLTLPDVQGTQLLSTLTASDLLLPAVILSASEEPADVARSLAAGAAGYICKSADSREILAAIRTILAGGTYTPAFYQGRDRTLRDADEGSLYNLSAITPRQMQVLQLLAQGLPNKRICQQLGLTEDTVKTHLKALFNHLQVHNRTECVAVATRLNLISPFV